MISGNALFTASPQWFLNDKPIDTVPALDVLGVTFGSNCSFTQHCESRVEKCRRSFHSLRDAGLSYPGANTKVKSYLWNSMCKPVLLYGTDSIALSNSDISLLESTQGKLLKCCLGFHKYCLTTPLLCALDISNIQSLLIASNASLFKRIMRIESPINRLSCYFLSLFILKKIVIPNTLIDRLIKANLSPIQCIYNINIALNMYRTQKWKVESGTIDALKFLLMSENFIKPYSEEHVLSYLLLRSF